MASKEKVIVVWKEEDGFGVLVYGDGSPRVYERDKLDSRLTLDEKVKLPYYATVSDLIEQAGVGSQHAAQIPLREAVKVGLVEPIK